MTTIDSSKKICTLNNVFTVDPLKQKELFESLKEASEKVLSKNARLHFCQYAHG